HALTSGSCYNPSSRSFVARPMWLAPEEVSPVNLHTRRTAAGLGLGAVALAWCFTFPGFCAAAPRPVVPGVGRLDPLRWRAAARVSGKPARTPEIVQMLSAVASGSGMGPGGGWFHPGRGRYDWAWLAKKYDRDGDGRITRKEFGGPAALFERLDRDRDG